MGVCQSCLTSRGHYRSLREAQQRVLELTGRLVPVKLRSDQRKVILRWEAKGYTVKKVRKGMEQSIYVELEQSRDWDFPEWCPYAVRRFDTHQVELHISKLGTATILEDFHFSQGWTCDWPQGEPHEPPTKIYAGTHPALPVRSVKQLGLPID